MQDASGLKPADLPGKSGKSEFRVDSFAGVGYRLRVMFARNLQRAPWLPYVAPMAAFVLLTSLEGRLHGATEKPLSYAMAYTAKTLVVVVVAWLCRSAWRDLRPRPDGSGITLSVLGGLAVAALWIGLDGHYPLMTFEGTRTAFNPDLLPGPSRPVFLTIRFFGLVLLVPLIEELFWRSFVLRWVSHLDFKQIPIGKVTIVSAAVSSVLFALAHPEWLPALITGLLWAWLLHRTRSVTACVISHAVANLALGVYVVATGAWKFW